MCMTTSLMVRSSVVRSLIDNQKGVLQKGFVGEFANDMENLRGGFANDTRIKQRWFVDGANNDVLWAVTFIPMPMPKTACNRNSYNKIVQLVV